MMKTVGRTVGGIIVIFVVLIFAIFSVGRNRLQTASNVIGVPVSMDSASIERGAHFAAISSCNGCHGGDYSGDIFINEAPIGYVPAPNLTSGAGGIGSNYTAVDWEMAIRHGVAKDGRALVVMPSYHYDEYSDQDLADLIAYMQSLTAVDNDLGSRKFQFMGNIIFGVLAYPSSSVVQVDHLLVGNNSPVKAPTPEYGEYLIEIGSCGSCHAKNLAGNPDPALGPLGVNITMGGELQGWELEDFSTALRTGITPSGNELDTVMPWQNYAQMDDIEVEALWAYLNSVEALPNNQP